MGVRENKVERYLQQRIQALGGECLKWTGTPGAPDRICILAGEVFAVEVKTLDGKLSVTQRRLHDRLRNVGMRVHVAHGRDGVDMLMESLHGR